MLSTLSSVAPTVLWCLGRFEPVPAHQLALRLLVKSTGPIERVELPEVRIEGRRVNDQNPQDLRPTVAERVRHAGGHQREPATLDPMVCVFDMECERPVEDVKGLTGAWMAMRRRPPRTYGDLALEEREPTVGVGP